MYYYRKTIQLYEYSEFLNKMYVVFYGFNDFRDQKMAFTGSCKIFVLFFRSVLNDLNSREGEIEYLLNDGV